MAAECLAQSSTHRTARWWQWGKGLAGGRGLVLSQEIRGCHPLWGTAGAYSEQSLAAKDDSAGGS